MSTKQNWLLLPDLLGAASLLAILAFQWYPGQSFNPHEWLNETMKQEVAKQAGQSEVNIGKWSIPSTPGYLGFQFSDIRLSIVAERINQANYSMLEVTVPDGRCFSADICLKHGEIRMRPCIKVNAKRVH